MAYLKNKKNQKILAALLCVTLFLNILFAPQKAHAWTDFIHSGINAIGHAFTSAGVFGQLGATLAGFVTDTTASIFITASKVAALLAVREITQAIIGKGGGGVIYDYNDYLFVGPHQRAMTQMNTFFNTVSRGRLSSLNYEGVGPNYDAYLVAQARQAIGGQNFVTNLQDQVTDPTQLFSTGNMKGIMTYMQCANNVACYSLTSTAKYNAELAKATEIAKAEQDRGFLPVKKNGKITQPSAIVASALTQIDQLGTQVIMNADADEKSQVPGAEAQIATGATINIAARSFNYMLADSKGKEAIRNKNDEFPFSLGYSLNGGIGISAGGVTANTGVGAIASQTMIGNTCATAVGTIDGQGATVTIQGRKYSCATRQEVTGTGPSVTASLPTYNCTPGATGNTACGFTFGNEYRCGANGKCVK